MAKKKVEVLFRLKCPLGYSVLLDVVCWTEHILFGYPELSMRYDDVQATIIQPDEIRENNKRNRYNLVYWKRFDGADKFNPYLCVPVCITNRAKKIGWVRSSYPMGVIRGGRKTWPK